MGESSRKTAALLRVSRRTLSSWDQQLRADRLRARPLGRPTLVASEERRAAATGFLVHNGPFISTAAFKAEHRDISRAELAALQREYRPAWRRKHTHERCVLNWSRPGSVWAIDFTHPSHRIDGGFPAIFNVRDLGSRQQLLWLPMTNEKAASVIDALGDLFWEHGGPLVIKLDKGPPFVERATKEFLRDRGVFALHSPPYCPRYNGACERSNWTMKQHTEHITEQAGRPGFRSCDDLLEARLRANRLTRPWGTNEQTPEQAWESRRHVTLDERRIMRQRHEEAEARARKRREIDVDVQLDHHTQAEIDRLALPSVLESIGLLHVTRGRATPPVTSRKVA
jgi:transposase InsO family protein